MKKRWILLLMLIFLLASCGNTEGKNLPKASETITVYESEDTFSHNMEGVTLMFDYNIQKVTGKVVESGTTNVEPGNFLLEINGKIKNEFSQIIYYTPDFTIQTLDQTDIEQLSTSVENGQILVNPQMETTFKVVYLIPKQFYGANTSLNLRVPAAFKEPDSESSGDALGDFADWEIPIK